MTFKRLLPALGFAIVALHVVEPVAQTPVPGVLVVHVTPAASLFVDGQFVGMGEDVQKTLPAGLHRLTVRHADFEDLRRVVRVPPSRSTTLLLRLDEKAIRKAARSQTQALSAIITDEDVKNGIEFFKQGDFEPAVETLEAAVSNLAGIPRMISQRAVAYLFDGAAWTELDQVDRAKGLFALALQLDRQLVPQASEFSPQVIALWRATAGASATDDPPLTSGASVAIAPSPPTANPAPTTNPAPPAPPTAPPVASPPAALPLPSPPVPRDTAVVASPAVADAPKPPEPARDTAPPASVAATVIPTPNNGNVVEFISQNANATKLQVVLTGGVSPCSGSLTIDRERQALSWAPQGAGCLAGFSVPFGEVRSPAAAPRGGLLLQFRSDRSAMTLMPAPDADLIGTDITPADLPVGTRVNMRRAHRSIVEALGRPYTDSLFGLLVDVPLSELLDKPADFDGLAVRTRGTLNVASTDKGPYLLTENASIIQLIPSAQTDRLFKNQSEIWRGKDVFVVGTFSRPIASQANRDRAPASTRFTMTVAGIEPSDTATSGNIRPMSIGELVKNPPAGNQRIRVIGRFRGNNYYGDLPIQSRRSAGPNFASQDWVIADGPFAVWVTDRPPRGEGFSLNTISATDRQQWVAITGTAEERKGYVYLRADRVELSPPPSDGGTVRTPQLRSGAGLVQAEITFSIPVEGSETISRDGQILIQFSKPMDEESFKNRVSLRYTDSAETFSHMTVTYYPERRSVTIDPGTALQPGRTLECVLSGGLKDVDGRSLLASAEQTRVLRWKVGPR